MFLRWGFRLFLDAQNTYKSFLGESVICICYFMLLAMQKKSMTFLSKNSGVCCKFSLIFSYIQSSKGSKIPASPSLLLSPALFYLIIALCLLTINLQFLTSSFEQNPWTRLFLNVEEFFPHPHGLSDSIYKLWGIKWMRNIFISVET